MKSGFLNRLLKSKVLKLPDLNHRELKQYFSFSRFPLTAQKETCAEYSFWKVFLLKECFQRYTFSFLIIFRASHQVFLFKRAILKSCALLCTLVHACA